MQQIGGGREGCARVCVCVWLEVGGIKMLGGGQGQRAGVGNDPLRKSSDNCVLEAEPFNPLTVL